MKIMTKKIIACYMILALGSSFLPLGDWPATWAQEGSSSGLGRDLRIEYLEFREVDIKDVLRQLSKQYNLNIAFSKSIAGLVTVQLHNVTIDEALDSIITVNGFVYTKKEDVIKELVESLITAGEIDKKYRTKLVEALMGREALGSTAIGQGVAIPHAKCDCVTKLVAAFGLSRKGIDFDSLDGESVYLFFLLVAPQDSAGPHLKALARISRLLKDKYFRESLRNCADAHAVVTIISEEDEKKI